MTLPRFLLIAACSWAILAALGTTGWCAFVARWRREPVNRIDHLPPVPRSCRQCEASDATWLSAWPVSGAHLIDFDAVHGLLSEPLEQQQVDRMFHEILACEGLS